MVGGINLPEPFGRVVNTYFSGQSCTIVAAYVDSKGYTIKNGLSCLRNFLGLTGSDPCSDCYCVVKVDNSEYTGILFEDKDINSTRSRKVNEGINTMNFTYSKLTEKKIQTSFELKKELAFLCNAKFEYPHAAKNLDGRRSKVLFNEIRNEPMKIKNTKIEIFVA